MEGVEDTQSVSILEPGVRRIALAAEEKVLSLRMSSLAAVMAAVETPADALESLDPVSYQWMGPMEEP